LRWVERCPFGPPLKIKSELILRNRDVKILLGIEPRELKNNKKRPPPGWKPFY
jgi:hypothetical protein